MLHSAKPFDVVLVWDPAFNPADPGADYEQFVRTRDHEAYLRTFPSKLPMTFVCRPLTHAQVVQYLAPAKTEDEQRLLAFMLSVTRVRNGKFRDGSIGDWAPARAAESEPDALVGIPVLVKSDECDAKFNWSTIQEVGAVALTRAFFDSPWSAPPYQLPPSSRAVLMIYRSRLAEEAKRLEDAATSSSKAAEADGPTSSATPGVPGDAPATASPTSAKAARRTRRSKSPAL